MNKFKRKFKQFLEYSHAVHGNFIQLIGVVLMGGSIMAELLLGGDVFLLLIAFGSMVFAVATKVKHCGH